MNVVRVTSFDIRGLTESEYNLLYNLVKDAFDNHDLKYDRKIIEYIIKMMVY